MTKTDAAVIKLPDRVQVDRTDWEKIKDAARDLNKVMSEEGFSPSHIDPIAISTDMLWDGEAILLGGTRIVIRDDLWDAIRAILQYPKKTLDEKTDMIVATIEGPEYART